MLRLRESKQETFWAIWAYILLRAAALACLREADHDLQ